MSKDLDALTALCYLDDIAHGRKMKYDAHELKLIVEKEIEAIEIIKEFDEIKIDLRDERQMSLIKIGNKIFTISYKNAKLLKEVLL